MPNGLYPENPIKKEPFVFLNTTNFIFVRQQAIAVWHFIGVAIKPIKWSLIAKELGTTVEAAEADSTETDLQVVPVDPKVTDAVEAHRQVVEANMAKIRVKNDHIEYVCKDICQPPKCQEGITIAEEKDGVWRFIHAVPTTMAEKREEYKKKKTANQ